MKIAICPEQIEDSCYAKKWTEYLKQRNVEVKWVDLTALDAFEQIKDCDAVMWRWIHTPSDKIKAPKILYLIERYLKIPVYPSYDTCWHYDDKISEYYLLKNAGFPVADTWIFWDLKRAMEWAKTAQYPKVFKLASGAASSNVVKVNSYDEAKPLINRMFNRGIFPMTFNEHKHALQLPHNFCEFRWLLSRIKQGLKYTTHLEYPCLPSQWWLPEKDYAYFQEFIPNNEFDTRVVIIGNRALAFRRFNRPKDFRASGSGKFDIDPTQINLDTIKIAFEISNKLNFQCMAYDFLIKNKHPVVVEISYTFPDEPYGPKLPGYWDSNLNWISQRNWPEEQQVDDFLKYIKDFNNEKCV